ARGVLVGGAVRNAFLGHDVNDWDIATDLEPGAVAALFPKVVRSGEKHGTIMVLTDSGPVEVTTFRGEGPYLDGRRPSRVVFHGNLEADLARRDFTINAMAADLSAGQMIDPFGGQADLRRRRIRCVGEPQERFAEDGLRPLRALRFAATLGFDLDDATAAALRGAGSTFAQVAVERKRDELERMLDGSGSNLGYVLGLMQKAGFLRALAPELLDTPAAVVNAMLRLGIGDAWRRFVCWAAGMRLRGDVAARILGDWNVPGRLQQACAARVQAIAELPEKAPQHAALRRWVACARPDHAVVAARIARLLRGSSYRNFPQRVAAVLDSGNCLSLRDLAVRGDDLARIGLEGPAVGSVLDRLLDAVLEDPARNQRQALIELAHSFSTAEQRR
ncbi:MAG: tRNA cytidylyltransferase, partial [Myxococcota bacterium]